MESRAGRPRRPGFDRRLEGDLAAAAERGGVPAGALVDELIARLVDAGTARVRLMTEPTAGGPAAWRRAADGYVDFRAGQAHLIVREPAAEAGTEMTVARTAIFEKHAEAERWTTLREADGREGALTDGALGVLELLRGAQEVLAVDRVGRGHRLRLRTGWESALYDDGSAAELFRIPPRVLSDPVVGTIDTDSAGLVRRVELSSERGGRMKVSRVRFVIELSEHGLPVKIAMPTQSEMLAKRPLGRLRRMAALIGYPATR